MPSLSYRAAYSLKISKQSILSATLSTSHHSLAHKELAKGGHSRGGRKDPLEHLFDAGAKGALANPGRPVLVIGVRNVLSNHRCVAYRSDWPSAAPVAVQGEDPARSQRPYHAMVMRKNGTLAIEEIGGAGDFRDYEWWCSGVPVAWDNERGATLMARMVAEAADQAHLYHLPRGDHPAATAATRAAWTRMHEAFGRQLYTPRDIAAGELTSLAGELGLEREHHYFHSGLGITKEGDLAFHVANGALEEIGERFRRGFDVERAICFENSGSVTVLLYPNGIASLRRFPSTVDQAETPDNPRRFVLDEPEHSLIAAPNKRRAGTAFLLLELEDALFDVLDG